MAPTTSRAPSEQTEGRQILDRLEELSGQVRALAERPAVAQVEFKQSWWDQIPDLSELVYPGHLMENVISSNSGDHLILRIQSDADGLSLVLRSGALGTIFWQRKLFYGRRPNGGR